MNREARRPSMGKVGDNIKALRERNGLSQKDLAQILGVPRTAVTEIEKGARRVTAEELVRLAEAFSVSVDHLLGLTSPPTVVLEPGAAPESAPPFGAGVRISVPQKNVEKFKEVLLYILNEVGAKPNIGETVLYKLLYFIDFDFYERYEEQLVGATYMKNHYGPTPLEFHEIVDKMIEDKEVERVETEYFQYQQKKYLPLRSPRLDVLSGKEIDVIDAVLARLSDKSAKGISEYSHGDVPWQTTENGEVIEYETVFYRSPEYSVRGYGEDDEGP
jgi:transcriptional regulator with XRE-family HTH domain